MRILIHTTRLSMIAGIIACLFYSHLMTFKQPTLSLTAIPLQVIQAALPTAVTFGKRTRTVRGAVELQNALEEPVGFCYQTSPIADTVIGFQSTKLLNICDSMNVICGISVLSGADIRPRVFCQKR